MKRFYERPSLLSRLLEWIFSLVLIVWLVRLALGYLRQHLRIVIAVVVVSVGAFIAYRFYDYKRRSRY